MKNKWDKTSKTKLFNERLKQRKEKEQERTRLFEEAAKPNPNVKKDDGTQRPSAPSTTTPAKPEAPTPKQTGNDNANRPGKAERERRGRTRGGGRRF